MTHAELSLDIPAAAWGRLAAVYRTLEWVSFSDEQGQPVSFIGVNCGRLMDQALSMMEVSALMVPSEVLVDPVVDLEVCCMVNSVVIRLVVLVEVEDVEV